MFPVEYIAPSRARNTDASSDPMVLAGAEIASLWGDFAQRHESRIEADPRVLLAEISIREEQASRVQPRTLRGAAVALALALDLLPIAAERGGKVQAENIERVRRFVAGALAAVAEQGSLDLAAVDMLDSLTMVDSLTWPRLPD